MKTRGKMSFNLLHLALEAHEVSQKHHMPRINFEAERITHSVLKFVNDAISSRFYTQRGANLHDVVAGDTRAPDAARGHNFSETAALDISATRFRSTHE